MNVTLESVELAARQLSFYQKARLVRTLVESLDDAEEGDADKLLIEEVKQRYEAFVRREFEDLPRRSQP